MKNVTIYSTPTCHFCHGAKEFFKEHNVAYTEKDVSGDAAARTEMVEKSGQMGVPLIDIEGKLIIGFDESALRKELQIA
ncbi:glutaredoxin family protein [Candidatus Kaiserbacteria bacterium]|nr:glutaredoxin family protein [Candidatus Kaiserbacteria bacterium]